jgi:chromosome segregation ATPase
MRIFDFLKKNELEKIKQMELQLEKAKPLLAIEEEFKAKMLELKNIELKKQKVLKSQEHEFNEALRNNESSLNMLVVEKKKEIETLERKIELLENNYKQSQSVLSNLEKEINAYEAALDVFDFGVYEPFYDFKKSETYRTELLKILENQKALIRDEKAVVCNVNWSVDGSLSKGKANSKNFMKLVLRAFNSECNALIANVSWNSVVQIKERIEKSFELINKVAEQSAVQIQKEYLDLKLQELFLEYEFQLKEQKEREIAKTQAAKQKEADRIQSQYETAVKQLSSYETQIEDVKLNLNTSTGSALLLLQKKIKNLEIKIKEAIVRKEKMELLVKNSDVGYVYIASNIGSFGENIYKIGITKSLKPLSSINSLSSAVPFPFDVHGLIFSEEVTHLERELHDAFAGNKVNLIHENCTFFNVSWDLIEKKVNALGSQVILLKIPEAKEFRETKMLQKQNNK